jgi:hypothetical protein
LNANLRELLVVLLFAIPVLIAIKPLCVQFMSAEDFQRRRTVWIVLTCATFVSPSLWLFFAVAVPLILWASKRDSNPLALYIFVLYATPNIALQLPVVGIDSLFEISHVRMLSFLILLPIAKRIRAEAKAAGEPTMGMAGFLLGAYCVLQVALAPQTVTTAVRGLFLGMLDVALIYYVFSRGFRSTKQLQEAMLMHVVALCVFAPLAIFEAQKFWLLYGEIYNKWDDWYAYRMILRDGLLRAQLSVGHPLALGYLTALAFSFWLLVGARVKPRLAYPAIALWLWLGLIGAYSRGPWLAAVVMFLAYMTFTPKAGTRLAKVILYGSIVGAVIAASPLGSAIIDRLPFVGNVESGTVDYRARLLDEAVDLIAENPFFGDPNILDRLQHLRDGTGLVDLVNGYVYVSLYYGLVTLFAVVGFFLVCGWRAFRASRHALAANDLEGSKLGAALVASIIGTYVYVGTAGFEHMMWMLGGMASAYAALQVPRAISAKVGPRARSSHSSSTARLRRGDVAN